MLRLIALITARYNWQQDEVSVGQAELARLWAVNERTVKREVKRLIDYGLLIRVRAGVRGRVAAYRLDPTAMRVMSRDVWAKVGTDFEDRMRDRILPDAAGDKVLRVNFGAPRGLDAPVSDNWQSVLLRLERDDPAHVTNWYSHLRYVGHSADHVSIEAASRFVATYIEQHLHDALERAVAQVYGAHMRVKMSWR